MMSGISYGMTQLLKNILTIWLDMIFVVGIPGVSLCEFSIPDNDDHHKLITGISPWEWSEYVYRNEFQGSTGWKQLKFTLVTKFCSHYGTI